ncbi:MAG TPA: carbohydrate-binding protein [Steroidobacteraceae bacterium]|nr:carbohydrate-binding protein [Steroidobacteraceae bacterium]
MLAGSIVLLACGTALAAPYSGTAIAVPATFQAEHFDTGGQRVSYYDTTSTNLGGMFRTREAVDIISAPSSIGGYVVSNMDTGEWMVYSFRVATAGSYDIDVRASSTVTTSAYRIDIDAKAAIGAVTVQNTGSLNTYQWTSKRRVSLAAGTHTLTVISDRGGFRLDAIRVSGVSVAAPAPAPAPTSTAKLLFKSGFDGGSLGAPPPSNCWGTGCWQDIVGLDSLTGFTWPGIIADGTSRVFHLTYPVTTTSQTIGNYSFGRIDFLTGPRGAQSSALMQQISRNVNGTAPMGTAPAQNALQFMPKRDPGDMYISYWLKLQPDLLQKMTNLPAGPGIADGGTWRAVFALKTGGQTSWGEPADNGDYRIEAYVMTKNNTNPYWVLLGDNNAGGGAPAVNTFRMENRNVPVPVGQWFKLEFFWHRSSGSDGRVWMAVNGQVVADRRGANMGAWSQPINRVMAPLLYSGSTMPIYQWVDDLEIWNAFPPAGSNTPYAPH